MEWDGGVEWNGRSGIGMGWRSGMGLRSLERVGKTSETSENVGGGLNEIWYMTWTPFPHPLGATKQLWLLGFLGSRSKSARVRQGYPYP